MILDLFSKDMDRSLLTLYMSALQVRLLQNWIASICILTISISFVLWLGLLIIKYIKGMLVAVNIVV